MTILTYTRNESAFSATVESLPPKALEYLLQYGWAQSLQDSIAGAEKAKRTELMETDQYKALPEDEKEGFLADEIALHIMGKLEARAEAIKAGTIGARVGQPRDPVSTLAREQIRSALAKAGKKIDVKTEAGKTQFEALVTAHIAKNGEKLKAEIARRAAESVDVEIDV